MQDKKNDFCCESYRLINYNLSISYCVLRSFGLHDLPIDVTFRAPILKNNLLLTLYLIFPVNFTRSTRSFAIGA